MQDGGAYGTVEVPAAPITTSAEIKLRGASPTHWFAHR